MYLENFIQELQEGGGKDYKVVLSLYTCGKGYEVPMTYDRIHFTDGKVVILADDN